MLSIAAIAIVYFITHYIAFLAAGTEESITPIWPAGGIGLAALILNPRRLWPAIIIMLYVAGFSASVLLEGRAFVPSLVFMAGNSLESLGCAWLITRVGGLNVRFTRVREVLALIGGALVVNGLTAIIGAGTAAVVRGAIFAEAWRQSVPAVHAPAPEAAGGSRSCL